MAELIIKTAADLKRIRKNQGFTMQSVADELGVTRETVTRWESGKENMTLATIERICRVIGVQASVNFEEKLVQ